MHKGEPFGVAVGIFAVHEAVIILEILVAGVIGWVNVNDVYFSGMGIIQHRQGVKVIALN
ncbi:hypothetical protein GCM10027299_52390 [Larkinella ripae]